MLKNWGYHREGGYLLDPGLFRPSSPPHPFYPLLNSFLVGFALCLCSYGEKLILLLFRRYIFSSEENPSFVPSCLLSPLFSISRFNPVRSAEGNSQNLLLGISWIIINAYAVARGIDRRVVLLLFLVLLLLLLLLIIILLCCHRWLPIHPFGKTTTMAWNNSIQRHFVSRAPTRFLRMKRRGFAGLIHRHILFANYQVLFMLKKKLHIF